MIRTGSFFLATMLLCSCANRDVKLLDEDAEESARRLRRMDLQIQQWNLSDETWDASPAITVSDLLPLVDAHCGDRLVSPPDPAPATMDLCITTPPTDNCALFHVCESQQHLCRTLLLREIALSPTPVVLTDGTGSEKWRLPPQDSESRAAVDQAAQEAALLTLEDVDDAFVTGGSCSDSYLRANEGTLTGTETSTRSIGETLASTLVEALSVGEAAAVDGSRLSSGLADRDASGLSNRGRAARLSWFDENLSRVMALQTQVGGARQLTTGDNRLESGGYAQDQYSGAYLDLTVTGIGSQPPCEGGCRTALNLLRISGAPLAKIIDSPVIASPGHDLDSLIAQDVSPRLAERMGRSELDGITASGLAAEFNMTENDVRQARMWMIHEANTFARPTGFLDANVPNRMPQEDGTPTPANHTYDRATMSRPEPPPAMHYITAARAAQIWEAPASTSPGAPLEPWARPERAYLFDYAHTVARRAIAENRVDGGFAEGQATHGVLATVLQDANAREAARTEVCQRINEGNDEWRIRVYGVAKADLLLADGTTALECAETGQIQGQGCTIASPSLTPTQVLGSDYTTGWADYVQYTLVETHTGNSPARAYWYVMRRRVDREAGPGGYESIGGISWTTPTVVGDWECVTLPYDRPSTSVAEVQFSVTSDVDVHAESRCGDQDLDGPIPLEDEIIDDGDAYETSWRHHLNVARAAAAHADELGQRILQAGVERDQIAQRAADTLATQCGVAVNLAGAFNADGTAGQVDLSGLVAPVNCTAGCPNGYSCIGTYCISDALQPADETRYEVEELLRCLGIGTPSETQDVTALGTQTLCFWYDPAAPNIICSGATDGNCPIQASLLAEFNSPSTPCEPVVGVWEPPPGQTHADTFHHLELFDDVTPEGAAMQQTSALRPDCGTGDGSCCALLREIRASNFPSSHSIQRLEESGFFRYENVRAWANRIGWAGYPLDYSEITIDGRPFVTTGYPFVDGSGRPHGSSAGWPCTGMPHPDALCPSYATDSLFCQEYSCTLQTDRAEANIRFGRAVATLGVMAGVGLSGLEVPVFYDQTGISTAALFAEVSDGTGTWSVATLEGEGLTGRAYIPPASTEVWHSYASAGLETHREGTGLADVSASNPFVFANLGSRYSGNDEARASIIARALWGGMAPRQSDSGGRYSAEICGMLPLEFAGLVTPGVECLVARVTGNTPDSWVIRRTLEAGATMPEDTVVVEGRQRRDEVQVLTDLFVSPGYDTGGLGGTHNIAHLFEEAVPVGEPGAHFTRRDVLDSLELMCEAARDTNPFELPECGSGPPPVYSMADVGVVQRHMRCVGARLEAVAQRQVVQGLPADVYRVLRGEAEDIRPGAGEYGQMITQLQRALRARAGTPRAIAEQLYGAAEDLEFLKRELRSINRERTIGWLRTLSTVVDTIATCASGNFGAGCGAVAAQLAISIAVDGLQNAQLDDEQRQVFANFRQTMRGRVNALETLEEELANGGDSVEEILAALRNVRLTAQSSAAQAAFADSDAAGRHYYANIAMRRLYNIDIYRYEEARRAAIRAAIVARRAIEQRFGVDLSEERCTSLVDPPGGDSGWADDICNATGINYADIRDPFADEPTPETARTMFIGDYVRRLEQYVDSYRFDRPYTSGDDTFVMSVRDDLMGVRGGCFAGSANLLGASNDLTRTVLPSETGGSPDEGAGEPAWHVPTGGCTASGTPPTSQNCLAVRSLSAADASSTPVLTGSSVPGATGRTQSPQPYQVVFGPGTGVDYTDAAAWVQDAELPPGTYRLSWYANYNLADVEISGDDAVRLSATETPTVYVASDELITADWRRYFRFFSVAGGGQTVSIGVYPNQGDPVPQIAEVAGIQLEDVTATVGVSDWTMLSQTDVDANKTRYYPAPFETTTAQGFAYSDACLTSDPESFLSRWHYQCDALCSGGFETGGCAEGESPSTHCYWEYTFPVTEEMLLARGSRFGGGFAFGNFNYRSGDIAVNLVGTGVRDCSGPGAQSCFGTATVPFSLRHEGMHISGDSSAYSVRTHEGDLEPVYLFDGNIESGRAVAAERYITNPVSSADRSLLADHVRGELRGRPLPGFYTLRIWDSPGLSFSRAEDVQILWNYRYFTRTGESAVESCDVGG